MQKPRALLVVTMVGAATALGSGLLAWQPPSTPPSTPPSLPPSTPPSTPPSIPPSDPSRDRFPTDRRPGDLQPPGMSDTGRSPFSFHTPQAEAKFKDTVRDLIRLEDQIEQSQQELMRKLGEARSLPSDRQNSAVMDILQQMLQQHEEMTQYLVRARTAWTGDVKTDDWPSTDRPITPPTTRPPGGGR